MLASSLLIKKTKKKGWGVFTTAKIEKDVTIEISPVIVMSHTDMLKLNETLLHDYIFYWEKDKCCMAMGYVPIYNHASPSNCEYFQDYKKKVIEIKTVRDIEKGEELTINYQGDADSVEKVWFEVH
jgi:uncharacterized protein